MYPCYKTRTILSKRNRFCLTFDYDFYIFSVVIQFLEEKGGDDGQSGSNFTVSCPGNAAQCVKNCKRKAHLFCGKIMVEFQSIVIQYTILNIAFTDYYSQKYRKIA